jgi:2-polyprenyl-3-methyl-5-hydroxy-6-metoxy-1,4-benzoquinol methylase
VADSDRIRCPSCRATNPQAVWPEPPDSVFRIRRCSNCELIYTVPSLPPEQILSYYPYAYYGRQNARFHPLFETLIVWFRRRRADILCRRRQPGRILDIGCGRGHFLGLLRERGWETQGVELCEPAVQHARDVLGLNVSLGGFDPVSFADDHFDVVMFWHVLEHLPKVRDALRGVARILRPGGILVIAVPNIASWQARLSRYHWFHLDLPRHYAHFSERWLTRELEELGFSIQDVNHFSLEQNPFGWIQSLLNRWIAPPNLLYDLLKNRSSRNLEKPFWRYPVRSICSFVGAALILPFALVMLVVETAFRQGATIELYAVKAES